MKLAVTIFKNDYVGAGIGYLPEGHHRLRRAVKRQLSKARRRDSKQAVCEQLIEMEDLKCA